MGPFEWCIVTICVISNALSSVLIKSSQHEEGGYAYSHFALVLLAELAKLIVSCILLVIRPSGLVTSRSTTLATQSESELDWKQLWRYAVPAVLFAIDNNLAFVVLRYLDPATFNVMFQLKIVLVAVLFKAFFRKSFCFTQKIALILLIVGIVSTKASVLSCDPHRSWTEHANGNWDLLIGTGITLLLCTVSASADVYCELVFKDLKAQSIHLQNAQLYFFGVLFNLIGFWTLHNGEWSNYRHPRTTPSHHSMHPALVLGLDAGAWMVLTNMVVGGLSTAAILKYLSNIVKIFVNAVAMVCTALLAWWMLGQRVTLEFMCGAVVVGLAMVLYNFAHMAGKDLKAEEKEQHEKNVEPESESVMEHNQHVDKQTIRKQVAWV